MQHKDLTATGFVSSRITMFLLVLMGVFFAFQPSWLGWNTLVHWLDDPVVAQGASPGGGLSVGTHGSGALRLVSFGLGCGFFLIAALSFEKDQIRVRIAEVMEALHQLLYGRDYARDREAIEILMRSLDAEDPAARRIAHENLVRLTGQHFADDPAVWRSWWEANKKTWARAKSGAKKVADE
jgi:hypothetical protein